uniref:SH3 domain containing 21 n=1 Tax=Rousettus aegyptiacus TaxID=9407 RepID=A0A7J8KGK2_ROUAE|nr:SH3 domain containing 21 [Rousettus aegyptiacus]
MVRSTPPETLAPMAASSAGVQATLAESDPEPRLPGNALQPVRRSGAAEQKPL